MVKDVNKENIDKNKKNADGLSEKNKLSSLKNEIKKEKHLEKHYIVWNKEELSNLKKEVKEKNVLKSEKENLSYLKNEIKEKRNKESNKKEIYKSEDLHHWKGTLSSKQIAIFSSWKEKNTSRPVEWIKSAYMDVADQIEKWTHDKNIVARWLAKLMNFILKSEK